MTIREFRLMLGIKQKDFAEKYSIPLRTLQDWESGRRTPPEYLPPLLFFRVAYDYPKITPPENYLDMIKSKDPDPFDVS